jgi:hypothetical protein
MLHLSLYLVDLTVDACSNEGSFLIICVVSLFTLHVSPASVTLTLLAFTGDLFHSNISLLGLDYSSCPGRDVRRVPKGTGVLLDSKV